MFDPMWMSIGQAVAELNKQIDTEKRSVRKLYDDLKKLNLANYNPQEWTTRVDGVHQVYTDHTVRSNEFVQILKDRKDSLPTNPTLEDRQGVAAAALDCAWFAIYAAQARIQFMETFEQAYKAEAIRLHIDYVVDFLITARRTTNEAQDEFKEYLETLPENPRPHVPPESAPWSQLLKDGEPRDVSTNASAGPK